MAVGMAREDRSVLIVAAAVLPVLVCAALSSAAWFNSFLTQPYGRFTITDSEDVEATVLLVLIALAVTQAVEVLAISRCRYVAGPVYDYRLAILDHDGDVTRGGHSVKVERDGLPTDEETALLVIREGQLVGHFVLTSAAEVSRPSLEQRRVAVLLADQVAAVVDRPAS
jgi:hypothetical protein